MSAVRLAARVAVLVVSVLWTASVGVSLYLSWYESLPPEGVTVVVFTLMAVVFFATSASGVLADVVRYLERR